MRMFLLGVLALLAALLNVSVDGVVVGIDFGSERIKTALVRAGTPFHIVVDEQSSRAVPSQVTFDKKQRLMGNDASSSAVRKSKDTIRFMHRLLGKSAESPQLQQLKDYMYPFEFEPIEERNAIGVKVKGESVYSPEEMIAMNFEHIKKITTDDTEGLPVKDVVVTVPAWFTQNERVALIDAAEMAGWNVLSLVNQNTAAALQYGIDRKFNASQPPHNVIFYNMGTSGTEVSLAEYTAYVQKKGKSTEKTIGQFEIKGVTFDQNLGGSILDDSIMKFMLEEFKKANPGVDLTTIPRPMAKLRVAAQKAKKVLSANQETPIFVVSLHDDKDFKTFITRDQLYEMNGDFLERVLKPLSQLIEDTKIELNDVHDIVILGGAVRVPAVKQKLREFMNREVLGESLNGDEAMALGAVFRAANLSTAFQVRKIGMSDVTPYPVGVRLSDLQTEEDVTEGTADAAAEGEEKPKGFSKRAQLFKRFNKLAKRKTVGFTHDKDFACSMHFDSANKYLPEGISQVIKLYNVTGLADVVADPENERLLADGQLPRVALSFSLSSSGIVNLVKAEATLEEMVEVKVPVKKAKAEKVQTEGEGEEAEGEEKKAEGEEKKEGGEADGEEKKEGEEAAEGEEKKEGEEAAEGEEKKEGEETEGEEKKEGDGEMEEKEAGAEDTEGTKEKEDEIEYEIKQEKKVHTFTLKYVEDYPEGAFRPMSMAQIKSSKQVLGDLAALDKLQQDIAFAKNQLESSIYEIRGKLDDEEIEAVSTEEQRDEIRELLAASEEWLYDQEDDDDKKFVTKLDEVKEKSDPIFIRASEIEARENVLASFEQLKSSVDTVVADIEANRTWIPAEDIEALREMVTEADEWLKEAQVAQEAKGPHEDPAWRSSELKQKLPPIAKKAQELIKRQKPKPKKEKKDKKKKEDEESETTNTDEETSTEESKNEETGGDSEVPPETETETETETAGTGTETENEQEESKGETEEGETEEEKIKEETEAEL